ncbi:MAG: alanyl-tRNA editing protein [Deltaproteobacteria bacterium]|nr:alanyl-tRNA editing protein [Candidatus Zymogenaceae bacterium]
MPVKKLFWEDPYLTAIEATITGVTGDVVTLDRTIVFAFSGGQQSDSGTIGRYEILDARKDGLEIFYTLPGDHTLKAGDIVNVAIDWEKRYRIMRLHFAAELVLELVYQNYDRPEKIGANITADKARVDFFWDGNIAETFPLLEARIRELVDANLEIISEFSDEADERRYWEIGGFARVACGGTHPKRTGEVGPIRLKRNNIGGGKERIEIYLAGPGPVY